MIGLIRLWREGLIGLLLVALAGAWLSRNAAEHRSTALRAQMAAIRLQLEHEREAVRRATALAQAQDAANSARAERDQIRISQEVNDAYLVQLADLRRRHDALRVRSGAAGADSGGGADAPVPNVSNSPGGTDDPAGEAGLSPARGIGFGRADALIASEQALRLKALQEWVRGQSRVGQQGTGDAHRPPILGRAGPPADAGGHQRYQ